MWWGQVICPRSSEWQGLDSCWLCLTQEPELLTMHCSVSRCPARPHNTPRRRLNMKQRLAAFQSVNTFITRCTKKAGRLESLYWTQQFRPVQALTSNSIWRFSISILKTWLTSQLLYLMEPFVDGVKKGSKRIYLFSFFSFHIYSEILIWISYRWNYIEQKLSFGLKIITTTKNFGVSFVLISFSKIIAMNRYKSN